MTEPTLVEVAVPLPVYETYPYSLAAGVKAEPGTRVLVSCGGRRVTGVVVAEWVATAVPEGRRVRPVLAVVDDAPVLGAELLEVVLRAARQSPMTVSQDLLPRFPSQRRTFARSIQKKLNGTAAE